nr:phosphatidylinositol 4-phosphate 5-kinase-like protein 1 [Dromaius novaehollandiae]
MAAAAEPEGRPQARRRWLFWRGHRQWKLLGVFEIDPEHEFYGLTCRLRAGLGAATQAAIDHPPADPPSEGDCATVLKQPHEGFELRTYAAPAFARLRRSLGLAEEEYQASLCSRGPYLQFISNSKSSADFFLTHDKRFFLKTQSKREIRFLLSNLPRYLQHLERYPHSLLVRFLGVHSIILPRRRKKYFIIMQSVFYPDERILERYDIKGCRVNRWAEPAPEGSPAIVVLKDCNFEGKTIAASNPLHVLDGPQLRYFVGVIDLFTVYGCRKRLEHLWKSVRYRGQAFSTVCPAEYARRLCRWAETHTL